MTLPLDNYSRLLIVGLWRRGYSVPAAIRLEWPTAWRVPTDAEIKAVLAAYDGTVRSCQRPMPIQFRKVAT